MLFQDLGADRVPPVGMGLAGGLLQGEQCVDGLPRPGDVEVRAALGDGGELAEQVRVSKSAPDQVLVAVLGRPGVMAGDPPNAGSTPAALIPSFPRLSCTVSSTYFPTLGCGYEARARFLETVSDLAFFLSG
jgi:hypothetical protein